jgi:hypothetical protein
MIQHFMRTKAARAALQSESAGRPQGIRRRAARQHREIAGKSQGQQRTFSVSFV